ncbi:MAG: hypothetical protein RIS94_3569, partial [Pseudomonadota bacterium]
MLDRFSLAGRTALVTGASRGIGRALADALSAAGAHVVLNARDGVALASAAAQITAQGGSVSTACFDVTDPVAVRAGIAGIEAERAIDILVNNAGIQRRAPLHEFDDDDWRELMATNLDGVYFVSKAVAPGMIARQR